MKIEEVLQIKEQMLGDYSVQAVSARALYIALGLTKDYGVWIKKRISSMGLVEHEDYEIVATRLPSGRVVVDHILSITWAKKVAMTSQSDAGAKVREYFLACEKTVQSNTQQLIASTNQQSAIEDFTIINNLFN